MPWGERRQTARLWYLSNPSDSGSRQLGQIISGITLRWCFIVWWVDLLWSIRDLTPASRNTVNFNNSDVISLMVPGLRGQQRVYDKLPHIRPWHRRPSFKTATNYLSVKQPYTIPQKLTHITQHLTLIFPCAFEYGID